MHVADRLVASITSTGSIACVGLDPRPALIPPEVVAHATARFGDPVDQVCAAFAVFNREILKAIAGACAVVKPQVACYEAYGWRGWRVLADTVAQAHDLGIEVIVDAKRSDIGSTAVHYRQAALTGPPGFDGPIDHFANPSLGGDWITTNPYLGADAIEPLIGSPDEGKGAFVLVRTSNPGATDFQDVHVHAAQQADGDGRPGGVAQPDGAYQHAAQQADGAQKAESSLTLSDTVATAVAQWGHQRQGKSGLSDVGAVVGATWPAEAQRLRTLMPNTMFLVPGYGAQGGTAATAVAGARSDGSGVVVSSSRQIIGAWQNAGDSTPTSAAGRSVSTDSSFAHHARAALDAMNRNLSQALDHALG